MAKSKILIIDRYSKQGTKSIKDIEEAVSSQGYSTQVMSHKEARKRIKEGGDILSSYHGFTSSGSGKSWKKGKNSNYVERNDIIDKFLAEHDKPGYAICDSHYGIAESLGSKIHNTGKFNRGVGDDGHSYNHKYGIAPKDLSDKVRDVETTTHDGKKIVKAFNYKNKRSVQYHPERTDQGKKELGAFFDKHLANYSKAA